MSRIETEKGTDCKEELALTEVRETSIWPGADDLEVHKDGIGNKDTERRAEAWPLVTVISRPR